MAQTFTKLNRAAMRKMASGEKINEHGISFQRLANGDGVFTVNIMVDGQRIHRVVGRESDGTTRTQAEEFIARAKSDAKNDRLALPKGRKIALTFKDAAERYLERLAEGDGKDLKMKTARLQHHLIPFFGATALSKVTSFDLERYKKHRLNSDVMVRPRGKVIETSRMDGKKVTVATINRELAVLSHLYSKAIDWEWIKHRPFKINRSKEAQTRIIYLTQDQAERLKHHAMLDRNPQVYPFTLIALGTSMRKMEILRLKKSDLDLERRVIWINKAKAGAREQPITDDLAEYLAKYLEQLSGGFDWLFTSVTAKDGHTVDVRKAFRRAVEAAGLDPDKIVRHTLRHTAITHLVQAGVDLPTVKRISGHKTLAMVERYSHQNGSHIQEAMDKLQARLKISGQ